MESFSFTYDNATSTLEDYMIITMSDLAVKLCERERTVAYCALLISAAVNEFNRA